MSVIEKTSEDFAAMHAATGKHAGAASELDKLAHDQHAALESAHTHAAAVQPGAGAGAVAVARRTEAQH